MKFASLCVLAYKRPESLKQCLESIFATVDYPHEIIVNLDGDDSGNSEYLFNLYKQKRISKLVMQSGNNRGVGRSLANCVGVAEGEYIFKIDTDLIFQPKWLSTTVKGLDDFPEIGSISLFDYRHYDPNDERFNHYDELGNFWLVDDFVTSVYAFKREYLQLRGWDEDDGFHKIIQMSGKKEKVIHLAITKEDMCKNTGFGVGKSTYVSGTEEAPFKTPTHPYPLVYQSGLNATLQ